MNLHANTSGHLLLTETRIIHFVPVVSEMIEVPLSLWEKINFVALEKLQMIL